MNQIQIILKNLTDLQIEFILQKYLQSLEQTERTSCDFMQFEIYQQYQTRSMVVILDNNKNCKMVDFIYENKRIIVHFNPLPENQNNPDSDPIYDNFMMRQQKQYPHNLWNCIKLENLSSRTYHQQFEYFPIE